jgi:hypothetical protein
MTAANDIVLRPRFKMEIPQTNEVLLTAFEDSKNSQNRYIVTRVDDHVFIKLPRNEQHFWSPQLHLEINEIEGNKSMVYGLFGPNPTVWTMFMFFHFIVAGLFIGFGIWAYTNWSLDADYGLQLFVTLFAVVIWFALYFAGRIGRASGKKEMNKLYEFMSETIRSYLL